MAIEFFSGFEDAGATNTELGPEWSPINGYSTSSTQVRTGGWALQCSNAGPGTLNVPPSAKKTIGFGFYSTVPTSSFCVPVAIFADTGVTTHLTLTFNSAAHLVLYRGPASGGTLLTTSVQPYQAAAWHYIEVQATIADTGGTCIVRVDGVEWINFTGDTRNAGTSTNIDGFRFTGDQTSGTTRWDDMYILNGTDDTSTTGRPDNDFLGDVRVEPLIPSADGAASAWTPSTGTAHAALVDESPPNTTDYVAATTNGLQDLWDLPNLNAADTAVFAIKSTFYAQKTDAGAASVKPAIREGSGTVTVDATAIPLPTSYAIVQSPLRKTKPGGGAWTVADVNALQLGIEKA